MPARVFPAVLFGVLAFTPAVASERCATHDEYASLKVAALQQQMMVAALTCHQARAYNGFVRSYRAELQRSDRTMLGLFVREDGKAGDVEYNAYKTRLANDSMLEKNRRGGFCRAVRSEFAALRHRQSLTEVAFSRATYAHPPFEDCGAGAPAVSAAAAPQALSMHPTKPAAGHKRHRRHGTPLA